MNAKQLSNLIPDIVTQRETSPNDQWLLMIHENKIICIPEKDTPRDGTPLLPITMKHVDKGLSGREWDRIIQRIAHHQLTHQDFYAETAQPAKENFKETSKALKVDPDETETTPDPD